MASKNNRFIVTSRCFLITLVLSILIVGGITGDYAGASDDERVSKLIEGARAEGKMVLYTNVNVTDSSKMIKKFEEKYPYLKIEFYRAAMVTLSSKIVNEAKAKKYIPDVIEISGFHASVLKKERLTASYISPECRAYPEGFKDPEGYWNSTYVLPYVIGYNTKLLSRKDIPNSYEGFLNPRWKGKKIGWDTKEVEWFANMLKIMGEEKGMDFFRKLVSQQLNYRTGLALITDLMIAGEFPVGQVYAHGVEDRKKKGAKVDWVGVAPVIAKFGTTSLAAHAPHPNTAKLYIDFVLSREGQMVIESCERLPARPDIEADSTKAFKGIKIYPSDLSLADKLSSFSKKSSEVFSSDRNR